MSSVNKSQEPMIAAGEVSDISHCAYGQLKLFMLFKLFSANGLCKKKLYLVSRSANKSLKVDERDDF